MSMPTEKDIRWMEQNKEGVFQIFREGYREGSKMRWPEMVFWMALIVWLFNLAIGGV